MRGSTGSLSDERCGSFAHDPATGRMWLVEPGTYPEYSPARVHQFDSTGKLKGLDG